MYISHIKLQNFRNYKELSLDLNPNINIFYGDNGQGKTNVIEAVFLCGMGKSFRTNKEQELIRLEENFSEVEVEFQKKDREGVIRIVLEKKKAIFLNGVKIKKLSDLLGKINLVIFSPDDLEILKEGPSKRRRFLDMMIGQLRPNYIHCLNLYLKTLEQRNNYLKQIRFESKQENMLEIWDEKLAEYAEKIVAYRIEFMQKIKEKLNTIHQDITEEKETLEIEYHTDAKTKEEFFRLLKQNHRLDMLKGYTTKGVHRDDFTIFINGRQVNIYGSQGQNRTVVLSLKLTELKIIEEEIGEEPILLLDDFMSELDEKRRNRLLQVMRNTQVLITCTDPLELRNVSSNLFKVENGEIKNKEAF